MHYRDEISHVMGLNGESRASSLETLSFVEDVTRVYLLDLVRTGPRGDLVLLLTWMLAA